MIIYKLVYSSKEEAISDLSSRNLESIVYIGQVIDVEAVIDNDGNEVVPATFKEGYCVDVMSLTIINFENIVFPKSPSHKFFGQ